MFNIFNIFNRSFLLLCVHDLIHIKHFIYQNCFRMLQRIICDWLSCGERTRDYWVENPNKSLTEQCSTTICSCGQMKNFPGMVPSSASQSEKGMLVHGSICPVTVTRVACIPCIYLLLKLGLPLNYIIQVIIKYLYIYIHNFLSIRYGMGVTL